MNQGLLGKKKSVLLETLLLVLYSISILFITIPSYIKLVYLVIGIISFLFILCCISTVDLEEVKEKKNELYICLAILIAVSLFVWIFYISKFCSYGTEQFLLCLGAFIFLFLAIFCSSIIFICHKQAMERASIMVVASAGLVYMFTMPVSTAPDEIVHAYTAYHTSNLMLGIDDSECKESGQLMMRYDDSQYNMQALSYTDEDVVNVLSQLTNPIQNEELVQAGGGVMYGNEYLFIPCATGLTVGRLLHLGTVQTFLLGRMFNFIFYLLICFLSLKLLPFGKELFTIILLFPMSLQQGMSYSYDAIINASAFLMVACSLRWGLQKEEKKSKGLLALCVLLSIVLFKAKGHAYASLAILPYIVLLMNHLKISEKKQKKIIIITILSVLAICVLILVVLILLNNNHLVNYVPEKLSYLDKDRYTISYFINHPKELIVVIYNSFVGHARSYISGCIGSALGWLEININIFWIKVEFVLLLMATVFSGSRHLVTSKRIILFVFGLLSICCVIFGMIINWTPVGAMVEWGVQGRYFVAVIFPITISLGGIKQEKINTNWLLILQNCLVLCMTFNMIAWFFR